MTDSEDGLSFSQADQADLNAPPDQVPANPPSVTRPQVLPFGELTWENFERLCYRIAGQSERVEYVARYGRQGQAQQGIDIFARSKAGKYEVWQAKRYDEVTAGQVSAIVDKFRAGSWLGRSDTFVLAVQASLADTMVQEAIEREAAALASVAVTLLPRGGEELSAILRDFPRLVDDFFGRGWVESFLGPDAAKQLGARLDGAEFARVRNQLKKYYYAHFHLLDLGAALPSAPGSVDDASPSLLERFTMPEVTVSDTVVEEWRSTQAGQGASASAEGGMAPSPPGDRAAGFVRRDYVRRTPIGLWLGTGQQFVVVGEAGSGKSTLLRCLALDLLIERGTFPDIGRRWGALLPIHVPFSRWSRLSTKLGRPAALREVVGDTLQPALTADLISLLNRAIDERRVLLLLDGLDEWSEEQAARTTLQHILAFVATHEMAVVTTSRPRGLDKIGSRPRGWSVSELAPLSVEQQRKLAGVWFAKFVSRAAGGEEDVASGPLEARLDRFFVELGRDRRISALAGNPLLLVGLVALSLRQIALPKNKAQAVASLVGILVETHPAQRATEAGDTLPRFADIPDAEERRAALARLAFAARQATGGGTYDIKEAKATINAYLADPDTFAYPPDRARRAASELLAVNSETVGLLAERAPGEVGFAHAAFEEYLAAEHVRSWPLPVIVSFVRGASGQPLWRNVISNLVSILDRPTEVQELVVAIENERAGDLSREGVASRDVLLADIAFGSSRKPPATAKRLIEGAFDTIERGDWIPVRREALTSALTNLGDAVAASPVDGKIPEWASSRQKYRYGLFEALATWTPTPELRGVLITGLHDEERANQNAAARTLGHLFAGCDEVRRQLEEILVKSLDLSTAAAALEALSIGSPGSSQLSELHDRAAGSVDPRLRLVGIRGRAAAGRADASDCDAVLNLLREFSELDYWDRPAARDLLARQWPNNPALVELALEATRKGSPFRHNGFEREAAAYYLLRCSPFTSSAADWVRRELKDDYPFVLLHDRAWDYVAPFAFEHADIRQAVISFIASDPGQFNLHFLQGLILALRSDDLRDILVEAARTDKTWPFPWPIKILLDGWGRKDPVVAGLFDEVASWPDDRLRDMGSFLPRIMIDASACRARLLSLAKARARTRIDLVASGLAALGCGADDDEVVELLMGRVGEGAPLLDPDVAILTHFSGHPQVRRYAISRLEDRSPPLAAIAGSFKDDAEIRNKVLAFANPLPTVLRGLIREIAAGEATVRPSFDSVLKDYDVEVDGELKIAASIHYHRALARRSGGPSREHVVGLLTDLRAVGPDLQERRAAAFAGLLVLGHVGEVVPLVEQNDKLLKIELGTGYGRESDSLMALVAERWEEMSTAFGDGLLERLGPFGSNDGHLWDRLAPHINSSPAARRGFLDFAERPDTKLGHRGLLTLAREQPSSEVLHQHCIRAFAINGGHPGASDWDAKLTQLEAAYILRDQFRDRADIQAQLKEALKFRQSTGIVALCLLDPENPLLGEIQAKPIEFGRDFFDWVTALHLASVKSGPEDFVAVMLAMLNRPLHQIWDFQEMTNRAVVERLKNDEAVAILVRKTLNAKLTESEIASLPRYLSAAGVLDESVMKEIAALLRQESRELLVRAGYDAVEDAIGTVSGSLLQVILPSQSW